MKHLFQGSISLCLQFLQWVLFVNDWVVTWDTVQQCLLLTAAWRLCRCIAGRLTERNKYQSFVQWLQILMVVILFYCVKIKHSCSEAGDQCENGSCSRTKWSIQVCGNYWLLPLLNLLDIFALGWLYILLLLHSLLNFFVILLTQVISYRLKGMNDLSDCIGNWTCWWRQKEDAGCCQCKSIIISLHPARSLNELVCLLCLQYVHDMKLLEK